MSKKHPNTLEVREKIDEFCLKVQNKLSQLISENEGDKDEKNGSLTKVITEVVLETGGKVPKNGCSGQTKRRKSHRTEQN